MTVGSQQLGLSTPSGSPAEPQLAVTRMPSLGEEQLAFWKMVLLEGAPFVYVIQGDEGGPVKIGTAVDVKARVAGLQTGNPQRLRLLHVLPGVDDLERQLHRRFKRHRIRGEWFRLDVLGFVTELAAWMVDGFEQRDEMPSFRRFGNGGWSRSRVTASEITTRFVKPDAAAIARRTRQKAWATEEFERRREENEARKRHEAGLRRIANIEAPVVDEDRFRIIRNQ